MYINNTDALKREVDARQTRRLEINEKRDAWVKQTYGIDNFSALVIESMPFLAASNNGRPWAALARQITSMNVEEIACFLGSQILGLKFVTLALFCDAFTSSNHDKRARVKIPWASWTKKNTMFTHYEMIAKSEMTELEMSPLYRIETRCGLPLTQFHSVMRDRIYELNQSHWLDVSAFHQNALRRSTKPPLHIFAERNGKVVKVNYSDMDATEKSYRRPPADWYYPLYLSWFLDGSMVLLETYENDAAGVPAAKCVFEQAMERVRFHTGFLPLIVQIPPLTLDMLYCNTHLFGINALGRIRGDIREAPIDKNTVGLFRSIADRVIAYR